MEPTPKKVYKEGEEMPGGVTIENTLNKDEGTLPFGLFNPDTEGKLTWICNHGPDGDVISVFCFDRGGRTERDVRMLKDLDEAKYVRDELLRNGWKKLIPPRIEFTMSGDDGRDKPLNRKEKRFLDRKIRQVGRAQANLRSSPSNDRSQGPPDKSSSPDSQPNREY